MSDKEKDKKALNFDTLLGRYSGAEPEALVAVLCPLLIPINSIDKTVVREDGQTHFKASFTLSLDDENHSVLVRGRTGKFVPSKFGSDTVWREIAKGRILEVDYENGLAHGEIYTGKASNKKALEDALAELDESNFLEIDQYGAAAKVLSGLAEYYLTEQAKSEGFSIYRMPEDMARHLGAYANYDFEIEKDGIRKRIEVKSLWGTNTDYARLIHSTTTRPKGDPETWTENQIKNYYPTSSCKYTTQDIFAVNLFLKTGNIKDFAFAKSISSAEHPNGLPPSSKFPDHVNQNPKCSIGDGSWFPTLTEVIALG
jgi:hypothetical protein